MFGREPLAVIEVVKAALVVLLAAGVDLAPELEGALIGLVVAILAATQRASVTPYPLSPLVVRETRER